MKHKLEFGNLEQIEMVKKSIKRCQFEDMAYSDKVMAEYVEFYANGSVGILWDGMESNYGSIDDAIEDLEEMIDTEWEEC